MVFILMFPAQKRKQFLHAALVTRYLSAAGATQVPANGWAAVNGGWQHIVRSIASLAGVGTRSIAKGSGKMRRILNACFVTQT
ncbi:hypothetical protein [Longimicrobium sp.]|uniref:hypothetical protein n=1 Tax=Longimicrobium sp. TaxID=2029185 RepID=UPI002C7127DF|nr:hypothetical protein [Longimicrobium sp.]HSU16721.1 hypothetical protein [Longimicrobium sp.]